MFFVIIVRKKIGVFLFSSTQYETVCETVYNEYDVEEDVAGKSN